MVVALSKIGVLGSVFGAIPIFCHFIQIRHVPTLGLSELPVLFIASAIITALPRGSLAILPWMLGKTRAHVFTEKTRSLSEGLCHVDFRSNDRPNAVTTSSTGR